MTESTKNQISKLVAFRYKLIGPTHHKDRDCHYKIGVHFKYAGTAEYFVEHQGYRDRCERFDEPFDTEEDAAEALVRFLIRIITKDLQISDMAEDDPGWDWADMDMDWYVERAKEWEALREELGL